MAVGDVWRVDLAPADDGAYRAEIALPDGSYLVFGKAQFDQKVGSPPLSWSSGFLEILFGYEGLTSLDESLVHLGRTGSPGDAIRSGTAVVQQTVEIASPGAGMPGWIQARALTDQTTVRGARLIVTEVSSVSGESPLPLLSFLPPPPEQSLEDTLKRLHSPSEIDVM
jgi:hypothetical protein